MTHKEIKQRRMEGAKAFIKWIDEREWCIARRDEADELEPVGMTMVDFYNEWAKDMFLIKEHEHIT